MTKKIESMKRLFDKGQVTKDQMIERVQTGKITEDEYKYITGEDYTK